MLYIFGNIDYDKCVKIGFEKQRIAKILSSRDRMIKTYGSKMAEKLEARLSVLEAANYLNDVPNTPPPRRHALSGDRKGEWAVDLVHPRRLIFKPDPDEASFNEKGELDLKLVKSIIILEVEDYH